MIVDEPPSSRSVQITRQKDKLVLIKKKPLKYEIKRRVYITDVRRTYAQMYLNIINSFDLKKVRTMYEEYCTDDITSVSMYDGEFNPYGANSIETKSIPVHLEHWASLYKSAPDIVFETDFLTAYRDPVTNICLVRCRFKLTATRIIDVKVTQKVKTAQQKKAKRTRKKYATSGEDLMAQIHDQLAASYSARHASDANWELDLLDEDTYLDDSIALTFADVPVAGDSNVEGVAPLPAAADTATTDLNPTMLSVVEHDGSVPFVPSVPAVRKRGRTTKASTVSSEDAPSDPPPESDEGGHVATEVKSMFQSGTAVVLNAEANFQLDLRPMSQAKKIVYHGTFTVYLDSADKICRTEFVYTAGPTSQNPNPMQPPGQAQAEGQPPPSSDSAVGREPGHIASHDRPSDASVGARS